jgi:hypothetical protein
MDSVGRYGGHRTDRMETKETIQILGCIVDANPRAGRLHTVCHDLLSAPHNESEPATFTVESSAAVLYPRRLKKTEKPLVDNSDSHDYALFHRATFPGLCRGHDDCGTIFAYKSYRKHKDTNFKYWN